MARPIPPKFYTEGAQMPARIELAPIGVVRSPHKERHGTPRQATLPSRPALRPEEQATLELFDTVLTQHALADLEEFEYIWVLTWLHLNHGWRNKVRPPGETKSRGLLSTRAPHRPNPIGLSAVRLVAIDGLRVMVERIDALDGTPILDIKPYVPYADAFPDARAGWVSDRETPEN
ncbi:MAG: tRNA (N6-threonylcarbamoyladenosine(37)-N6)-methyltransferase TrmO [Myxococcota bacterium]